MGTSSKGERPATQDATSPAAVFRSGSISAAVYTKDVETKNGKAVEVFNVSLRRGYQDAKGDWQNTHTLRGADLLHAAYALTKCYDFVSEARGLDDEERE